MGNILGKSAKLSKVVKEFAKKRIVSKILKQFHVEFFVFGLFLFAKVKLNDVENS